MIEYMKNIGLKFNGTLKKRAKTDLIVLHHTEGGASETVQAIHSYHLSRGHKGIDYNICVLANGDVVDGRGLENVGGHTNNAYPTTKGVNARSVGIVALGNFNKLQMPQAQLDSLKRVVRDVAKYYGITDIKSHKEIAGAGYTDCPGNLFPIEEIRAYALEIESPTEQPQPKPQEVPKLARLLKRMTPAMRGTDVKQVQTRLDRHLVDVGGCDGIFGAKTKTGIIKFQRAHGLGADGIVGKKTWAKLWE